MSGPKETFYDERVFPLMGEIIKMCKEKGISMLASFELDFDEDDGQPLMCSTQIILPDCESPTLRKAADVLYPPPPICIGEMIETLPDGTKRVTITRL